MAKDMLILTVGHVAVQTAVELAHFTHKELKKKYKDVIQIPIYSQGDVVATFARVIPFDLIILALDLQDRLTGDNPLVGETFMIEAQDLKEQSASHLQTMAEDSTLFLEVVDCFWQESLRQKEKMPLESVHTALRQGVAQPQNNVTEAASLLSAFHQTAQKAIRQGNSLVLHYEWGRMPRVRAKPVPVVHEPAGEHELVVVKGNRLWQTQKRPLLIALFFAVVFTGMGWVNGLWPLEDATSQQDILELVQLFALSGLGVMTPLWLLQGWLLSRNVDWRVDDGETAVWFGFGTYRFKLFHYHLPSLSTSPATVFWICVVFGFLLMLWCIPLYNFYPPLAYWLFPAWLTSFFLAISGQSR